MGNLRGQEVAAIEDTMNDEVLFLKLGERIGDFEVRRFQENIAILVNIKNGKELELKREVD